MLRRQLLSWLAILGTSGCSFGLDGPARSLSSSEKPVCDDSKGVVVLDGFVAVGTGIGALVALDNEAGDAGAVLGIAALLYTIAAVRGNGVVNRCRTAQDQFALANQPSDVELPSRHIEPAAVAETPRQIAAPEPTPSPSPNSPTPPSAPKPAKAPAAPVAEPDDWSAFWEEVP